METTLLDFIADIEKLLKTTGAKLFGSQAGAPTEQPLYDNEPELYAIHKNQRSSPTTTHKVLQYLIVPTIVLR